MDRNEFRIGQEFWCSDRGWLCTDIGTRVIIAIRVDEMTITTYDAKTESKTTRTMTGEEAGRDGWFTGPPYAVAESVFDEYDMEACTLTKEEQ